MAYTLYNKWIEYKGNQENRSSPSSDESNNLGENLIKYAELYEKGLLSEEEFTALKKKILGL
jgi:NAD+--asparagine ADP-ribosyltransferase